MKLSLRLDLQSFELQPLTCNALSVGCLWYDEPERATMQSATRCFSAGSDDAVIRVHNGRVDPVQTREDELNLAGELSFA